MNFFDAHCDTLVKSYREKESLFDGNLHVNFKKMSKFDRYIGCFAIWIDDKLTEDESFEFFNNIIDYYVENRKFKCKNTEIVFTLEGSKPIGNDLSRISYFKKKGIRVITLTWNGPCRIGDGCKVENSKGLSDFGKKAVVEIEKNNIIIDISHASKRLFYDVCEFSSNPIIATHSNSKSVCDHVRNLTDDQFKIILERKGIVGINLYKNFLSLDGNPKLDDIERHIYKFLSLGGENAICFGTDFDGCDPIEIIPGIENIEIIYNYLLKKNYSDYLVEKLFFENARNFFTL